MGKKTKLCLNGSSYIYDMEFEDRYDIVNNALWISLLSLVGETEGIRVELPEKSSKFLVTDLQKTFEDTLIDTEPEFLILDMCYTAWRPLIKWQDQVFTRNPKFVSSDFYKEHIDETTLIDVLNDDEFDWHPYMDRYIKLISKYFDKNHIILVKSRCSDWYVTHTHVRKLGKKAKRQYNKRIAELENYFVEKVDPYIVDIYKYYMIDFNHKRGYNFSSYEKPFYYHARRLISYIIRNQPEKRVYNEEEYFIKLGRFIKYYDNLYAKNRVHLMMPEECFTDHLVLKMSRKILSDYELDFDEFQKRGYSSYDEVLSDYNFEFAEELKQCIMAVKAVENGDIYNEEIDYDYIFKYDLKIQNELLDIVVNEYDDLEWFNDEIHIKPCNLKHFYHFLRSLKNDDYKNARKYILENIGDHEDRSKLKNMIMKERNKGSNEFLACMRALNTFYTPIYVDIWGSCITREILNEDDFKFAIGEYAYRNSFLFAFDEPIEYDEKNYEDLSLFENSTWRLGYIKSAFRKDIPEILEKSKSKWLLLDFYDCVCDIVHYKNGYFTADKEVRALKFYKNIKKECKITSIDRELDDAEIKKRFDRFIEFITKKYGKDHIIFIRSDVKTKYLDYKREFQPMRGYKRETLIKKKKFLNKWQDYFEKNCECRKIDIARSYKADDLCVSGAFMVHYEKKFYERAYDMLLKIIYRE